jgi:RNA polymerase sigma-70 factor (ECF subfamily)
MADRSLSRTSETLLGRLRSDPTDQAAWDAFVDRYGGRIYAWCRQWGCQDADAEDTTQEVLRKLFRELKTFQYDRHQSFRSWLKSITRTAFIDGLRKQRHQPQGSGDTEVAARLESAEAQSDLFQRLNAEFDLELLEKAEEAVRARVQESTWLAYELTDRRGQSSAEAAKQLGLQVAIVDVYRSRVRGKIKEALADLKRESEEGDR